MTDIHNQVSPDIFTLPDLQEMTRNASRLKAQGDIAGSTCLLDLIAFTTNELTKRNVLTASVGDKKQVIMKYLYVITHVYLIFGIIRMHSCMYQDT